MSTVLSWVPNWFYQQLTTRLRLINLQFHSSNGKGRFIISNNQHTLKIKVVLLKRVQQVRLPVHIDSQELPLLYSFNNYLYQIVKRKGNTPLTDADLNCVFRTLSLSRNSWQNNGVLAAFISAWKYHENAVTPQAKAIIRLTRRNPQSTDYSQSKKIIKMYRNSIKGWVFYILKHCHIGMGVMEMRENDKVMVPLGYHTPVILRKVGDFL